MEKYQELKQGKKYTYVLYGMSDDKKNIVVLDASTDRDFDAFTAKLPEKDCRWAVYDFQYDLGADGVRNKLAFIMWYVCLSFVGSGVIGLCALLRRGLGDREGSWIWEMEWCGP
jgi:hypothetical protein